MALTSGFFNSKAGDRKYNAEQMGEIFDGILTDGIIPSYGQIFDVNTANNGMQITVGTGRAWFDHTWTKNDSVMVLTVPLSDITRPRYDTVVLEVNRTENVRANSIKIITGVPSINTTKPILINTLEVKQYPLAHIYVPAAATTIKASNIENMVGRSPTIFATGILQPMPIDDLWSQWDGEFHDWLEAVKKDLGDLGSEAGGLIYELEQLKSNVVYKSDKATTSEAKAGTNDTHWMTPAKTKDAFDSHIENTIFKTKIIPIRDGTPVDTFLSTGYETRSYYFDLSITGTKGTIAVIQKSSINDNSIPKCSTITITLPYESRPRNFYATSTKDNDYTPQSVKIIADSTSNTFLLAYTAPKSNTYYQFTRILSVTINSQSSATVGTPYSITDSTISSSTSTCPYITGKILSDGRVVLIPIRAAGDGVSMFPTNGTTTIAVAGTIYIFSSTASATAPNVINITNNYISYFLGFCGNYMAGFDMSSKAVAFCSLTTGAVTSRSISVASGSTIDGFGIITADLLTNYLYFEIKLRSVSGSSYAYSFIRCAATPSATITTSTHSTSWDGSTGASNSYGYTRLGPNDTKKIYYVYDSSAGTIKGLSYTNNFSVSSTLQIPGAFDQAYAVGHNFTVPNTIWCRLSSKNLSIHSGLYNLDTHEVLCVDFIGGDTYSSTSGSSQNSTMHITRAPANNWTYAEGAVSGVKIPINIRDRIAYMREG